MGSSEGVRATNFVTRVIPAYLVLMAMRDTLIDAFAKYLHMPGQVSFQLGLHSVKQDLMAKRPRSG